LVEKIFLATEGALQFQKNTISGKEIRYVDWLVAGMIGMNIMFAALFGVGYVIVRYRKNGVLKRLKATPLSAWEFLTAQILSRFLLIFVVSTIVFIGCYFAVNFVMIGSIFDLAVVVAVGTLSLISLSLIIAARTASEELAGGLLNLLSWPMMFLSGVWFSLEGSHPLVQKVANLLPLTHMISSMRAIMTEGATLAQLIPQLTFMGVMGVVFLGLGAWLFKWE
jgi:ABC-type multidrug transport system permease subunit